jgi:hypothetical protein
MRWFVLYRSSDEGDETWGTPSPRLLHMLQHHHRLRRIHLLNSQTATPITIHPAYDTQKDDGLNRSME